MASFAKAAALLLCVCLLLSASSADAASIRGRELQASIANCKSHKTITGGKQVCTACTTGYVLIPGDGGCARESTTVVKPGVRHPEAHRRIA
ncbi:hypothetical protein OEZ85_000559 [Tetradesmus obliquus]|uniref:Uncharacterized protein n=1 Tax=Tetradesmus obliquus TaxID=3088 RepID=A0ABY8UM14_TETOB|nr:hypothetical protein OEZ85_000559 [Tetradesmus obliquus]